MTVDGKQVLDKIDADELVKVTLDLANIDSPTGSEGPVADYVHDWLCRQGFDARKVGLYPDRPNVIVPEVIAANQERFGRPGVTFICADLTHDALPHADAILCRDCFQHLPTRLIRAALRGFTTSGARWLLLTQDENVRTYSDVPLGSYRSINFRLPPFNFPPPDDAINEDAAGRQLALWEIRRLGAGG